MHRLISSAFYSFFSINRQLIILTQKKMQDANPLPVQNKNQACPTANEESLHVSTHPSQLQLSRIHSQLWIISGWCTLQPPPPPARPPPSSSTTGSATSHVRHLRYDSFARSRVQFQLWPGREQRQHWQHVAFGLLAPSRTSSTSSAWVVVDMLKWCGHGGQG